MSDVTPTPRDASLVKGYAQIEIEEGLDGRVAPDFARDVDDDAIPGLILEYTSKASFYLLALAGVMREGRRRVEERALPPELGRVRTAEHVDHCSAAHCQRPFDYEFGFYLYKDLETDKLAMFCKDCAMSVELNMPDRFKLVAL